MRSRVFVVSPPRSKLVRTLWLVGAAAVIATLLFFSAVVISAGVLFFGLAWLVRRVIRPHRAPQAQTPQGAQVIEGEFVVIEPGRRPLP